MQDNFNDIIVPKNRKAIFQKLCSATDNNNPIPTWYFIASDKIDNYQKDAARKKKAKFIARIQNTVGYEQIHGILKSTLDDHLPEFAFSITLTPLVYNEESTRVSFVINPILSCDQVNKEDNHYSKYTISNSDAQDLTNTSKHKSHKKTVPISTGIALAAISLLLFSPLPNMMFSNSDIQAMEISTTTNIHQISTASIALSEETKNISKQIKENNKDSMLADATLCLLEDNTYSALSSCQSAIDKQPANLAMKIQRDAILAEQGQTTLLLESFDAKLQSNPDDLDTIIQNAMVLLKSNDPTNIQQALESFEDYLQNHTDSFAAKLFRDQILVENGYQYSHIVSQYNDTLQSNPNDFESTILKANIWELELRYHDSLALLDEYTFQNNKSLNNDETVIINLAKGNLLLQLHDYSMAAQVYKKVLDIDSDNIAASLGYNHAVIAMGEYDKVIDYDDNLESSSLTNKIGLLLGGIIIPQYQEAHGDKISVISQSDTVQVVQYITQRTIQIIAPPPPTEMSNNSAVSTSQIKSVTMQQSVMPDIQSELEQFEMIPIIDEKTQPTETISAVVSATVDEETTVLPVDEETTVLPVDEETTVLPVDEETTVLPVDEETTVLPVDEETTVLPVDEETTVLPVDEETTVLPVDEETTVLPVDEETTVLPELSPVEVLEPAPSIVVPIFDTPGSTGPPQITFSFGRADAMAIDDAGQYLYTSDHRTNTIQKFEIATAKHVLTIGEPGNDIGQLDLPFAIAVDSKENSIYVADGANNRIQKFDSTTGDVIPLSGDITTESFTIPAGIVLDSQGYIYVADSQSWNSPFDPDLNRIIKFDSEGNKIIEFGDFYAISGIALDNSEKYLYVSDINHHQVQRFDLTDLKKEPVLIGEFGTNPGQFNEPYGIVADSQNNLYVVDYLNHRIQKFDSDGNLSLVDSFGDSAKSFNRPTGIAINSETLYIADRKSGVVQVNINEFDSPTPDDLDGIAFNIDTDPENFSNDFSDVSLGGTTSGTILNRGDQTLEIVKQQDSIKISTSASEEESTISAKISICDGISIITMDAGDEVLAKCGSAIWDVVSGTVDVEFVLDDNVMATAILKQDQTIKFDPDDSTITTDPQNTDDVTINLGDSTLAIPPDETTILDIITEQEISLELNLDETIEESTIDTIDTLQNQTRFAVSGQEITNTSADTKEVTNDSTETETPGPEIDAMSVTSSSTPQKKNGSSCTDCTPPTLGLNKDGERMVDNGFSFQGIPVDSQYYFTPFPLLGVQTGAEYVTTLKIYENHGPHAVQHVGLAFGLDKNKIFGDSEVIIELDRVFQGEEFTVSTIDPNHILEDNVRADTTNGPCLEIEDETAQTCLIVDIYHTFREPLPYKMIGTYIWDFHKNGWQNYFNHGIQIMGESLNPADTINIRHDRESLILTIQDVYGNTATDEYGNTWFYDKQYSSWKMEYVPSQMTHDVDVPMQGLERTDSRYELYKQGQEMLAQHVLDTTILYGKQIANPDYDREDNYKTIIIEIMDRENDPVLQDNLILEQKRAQETFEKEYEYQK